MVVYNLIKELKEKDLFDKCIKNGIISFTYQSHLEIYEAFKKENTTITSKMQCYSNVGEYMGVSWQTVSNVVYNFEK